VWKLLAKEGNAHGKARIYILNVEPGHEKVASSLGQVDQRSQKVSELLPKNLF